MSDTIIESPDGQKWLLRIEASGEVRDADGNLVEQNVDLAAETVVTEAQMREQLKEQ